MTEIELCSKQKTNKPERVLYFFKVATFWIDDSIAHSWHYISWMCLFGVIVLLNNSVTSKAPPHHDTSSSMLHGRNLTWGNHPLTFSASHKDKAVGNKILGSDKSTDFHWSNVHSLCFLDEAILLLLFFLSSGLFAAIRPWRPNSRSLLWTVDVEMCLLF